MNLFVAIFPDNAASGAITAAFKHESDRYPDSLYRAIRPEKRHVTLLFLGDHEENVCEEARLRFTRWAEAISHRGPKETVSPAPLVFDRLGAFPPNGRARTVALTSTKAPAPSLLAVRAELEALFLPLITDRRPFRAHLTLAYPKRRIAARGIPAVKIEPICLSARWIALVVTEQTDHGARYRVLAEADIGMERKA